MNFLLLILYVIRKCFLSSYCFLLTIQSFRFLSLLIIIITLLEKFIFLLKQNFNANNIRLHVRHCFLTYVNLLLILLIVLLNFVKIVRL